MPIEQVEPLWKGAAAFGLVGLICVWLLIKDFIVGARERASRHRLADKIEENAKANAILAKAVEAHTAAVCGKIEDLSRALWQFILTRSVPKTVETSRRDGDPT